MRRQSAPEWCPRLALLAAIAITASAAILFAGKATAASVKPVAGAEDDGDGGHHHHHRPHHDHHHHHLGRHLSADDPCANFCSGKAGGLYPNPCDATCTTFFNCANGITSKQTCASVLMFNPTISVCDWPSNVVCKVVSPPSSSPPLPPSPVKRNPFPPSPKKSPSPSPRIRLSPPLPPKRSPSPSPRIRSPPPPPPKKSPPPPPSRPPPGLVFGPYKDVTINMDWNTNVISSSITGTRLPVTSSQVMPPDLKTITWSFATGECGSESWAGIAANALVSANVQAFVNAGKQYIIATGGAAGSFRCGTDAGFTTFLNRYSSSALVGVDFDIEAGQSQADIANLVARVKAARAAGPYGNLRYSFTLATLGGSSGNQLNALGTWTMNALKNAQMGWNNIFVNLMVMDYGGACTVFNSAGLCDMGQSAINAAKALNSYWGVPYSSIELTPMIGGNDSPGQTFTLGDVKTMSAFVKQSGIGGVHHWSLDRDVDCPPGAASPTCNSYGVAGTLGFTKAFLSELGSGVNPGPTNNPPPPPPSGGGTCTYTIKAGDTLWDISQVYGTTVAVLQALNPGVVPTALQVGQVINVPCIGPGPGPKPSPDSSRSPPPPPQSGTVLYSGSGSGTYYFDVKGNYCPQDPGGYAENNGYPACASWTPGTSTYKTLAQLGSNNVLAIDNVVLSANRARLCGKKVLVYKDGVRVAAPDGGDFFVWDGCAACAGGVRLDFSVSGLQRAASNACTLGVVPGVTWQVVDEVVQQFVP